MAPVPAHHSLGIWAERKRNHQTDGLKVRREGGLVVKEREGSGSEGSPSR